MDKKTTFEVHLPKWRENSRLGTFYTIEEAKEKIKQFTDWYGEASIQIFEVISWREDEWYCRKEREVWRTGEEND